MLIKRLKASSRRFLLFSGVGYEPCAGWHDFNGTYHTLEDAIDRGKEHCRVIGGWFHVVDLNTYEVLARGGDARFGNFKELPDLLLENTGE